MAKVLPGAIVSDIRQKIGGTVFQASRAGLTIRARKAPRVKSLGRHVSSTFNFNAARHFWNTVLTHDQKQAWSAFGVINPVRDVFGNSIELPGYATFQRFNVPLSAVAAAMHADPPADTSVTAIPAITGTAHQFSQLLSLDSIGVSITADEVLAIEAGPARRPGPVTPNPRYPRLLNVPYPLSFPIDLTALWQAQHGTILLSYWIPISAHVVNTVNGAYGARVAIFVPVT